MDWKQPESLRRHWVLEDLDSELLFSQIPVGAAQGRVGDDVYDLRDGGHLRKRRTLLSEGEILATLVEHAAGGVGTLEIGGQEYTWKPTNVLGSRWTLYDADGRALFSYVYKPGLAKVAKVEIDADAPESLAIPLLLCWYATVL